MRTAAHARLTLIPSVLHVNRIPTHPVNAIVHGFSSRRRRLCSCSSRGQSGHGETSSGSGQRRQYRPPWFSVAPMMDWTDNHFRTLSRLISKHAWLYTEMVVAETIVHQKDNLVEATSPSLSWLLLAVYAHANHRFRENLWSEIAQFINNRNEPTMLIGDTNSILSQTDKKGGTEVCNYQLSGFRNFIRNTGLIDLGFKGPAYTWTNRSTKWQIKECLDWALANPEWRMKFPEAEVLHLPRIGSDNNSILLQLEGSIRKKRGSFKFELMWIAKEELEGVIKEAWDGNEDLYLLYVGKIKRL